MIFWDRTIAVTSTIEKKKKKSSNVSADVRALQLLYFFFFFNLIDLESVRIQFILLKIKNTVVK